MLHVQRHGARKGEEMIDADYSNSDLLLLIIDRIHSVRDRKILVDRFIHGMTYEQIAERNDLSVRHTKNIVYRAQERLFK